MILCYAFESEAERCHIWRFTHVNHYQVALIIKEEIIYMLNIYIQSHNFSGYFPAFDAAN